MRTILLVFAFASCLAAHATDVETFIVGKWELNAQTGYSCASGVPVKVVSPGDPSQLIMRYTFDQDRSFTMEDSYQGKKFDEYKGTFAVSKDSLHLALMKSCTFTNGTNCEEYDPPEEVDIPLAIRDQKIVLKFPEEGGEDARCPAGDIVEMNFTRMP